MSETCADYCADPDGCACRSAAAVGYTQHRDWADEAVPITQAEYDAIHDALAAGHPAPVRGQSMGQLRRQVEALEERVATLMAEQDRMRARMRQVGELVTHQGWVVEAAETLCASGWTIEGLDADMGRMPLRLLRGVYTAIRDYRAARAMAREEAGDGG